MAFYIYAPIFVGCSLGAEVVPQALMFCAVWCAGVWYMHCHFEFHLSMGMTAVFIVEDGPTMDTSLPPPPADFPTCGRDDNLARDEVHIQTKKSEVSRVEGE